jgi:predicted ATP-grasp superfamily ATP-dependent carboligase
LNSRAKTPPDLAVIAACARPFVAAAARAGYRSAAFDIFNDVETRRSSLCSSPVAYRDGGFDAEDLWRKLCDLCPEGTPVVYGSGLENKPQLIARIAGRFRLLGNTASCVGRLKDPVCFFGLLDLLGIPYPETRFEPPADSGRWLVKQAGGSGGMHVRPYSGEARGYYQRLVDGLPVSLLFLAHEEAIEIVGYNEQWTAPAPGSPFRYGGAVGNAALPQGAKDAMAEAASKLAAATGLRGLNSMDFMLDGDKVFALEVNPRLSASFDLYPIPDLLQRHIRSCQGVASAPMPTSAGSKAHLIYFAPQEIVVGEGREWPDWVVDLPAAGQRCFAEQPLCSVLAEASDAAAAKALAFARARQLDAQLRTF